MSEKNIYVFGTYWADKSILKKYLDDKVVFLDNQFKKFSDIACQIKSGDIIVLRTGTNMQHNVRFSYIGIANKNAQVQKMYSTYPLYEKDTYNTLSHTDKDTDAIYVTIDKWYEITDEDNSAPGMADRIIKVNKQNVYNKIMYIYNKLIVKDANKMTNKIYNLLTTNHNLVLTGAPGTGKTHLAKQIAAKMIFGEDISIEDTINDESKKKKFDYQCKFVQFHPSYDYTDFVEGIRPVTKEDNNSGFERKDGVFKEFCKRAIVKIEDVKEFCDLVSKRISDNQLFSIKNISEQENNSPITFIEYDDSGVRVVADTEGNQTNGFSKKSYNELCEYYKKYVNNYVGLKEKSLEIFKSNVGVKEGEHTYIHGFLHAMYEYFHKPFIFIIDEINRGDFNKIFGELFYAIDPGYRGEKGKVDTQYQNLVKYDDIFINGFYIPENVYIIGTMNDIDRSVESMDFAIRRRFAWQEIAPKDTAAAILKKVKIQNAELILEKFNELIASPECLGKMYQLGASYFLKLNNYIDDYKVNDTESIKEAYKKLWNNHLHGLIYEYVRGKKSGDDIYKKIYDKYLELTGINPIAPNKEEQQEQED